MNCINPTPVLRGMACSFFLPLFILLSAVNARGQNVGIGTTNPVARFHVADSSVLFVAPGEAGLFPGNPPVSGAGRRMMWYADKGAFRAGYVDGNQWDKNNIGHYSFASGSHNMANGGFSTAMGGGTIASGAYSMTNGYSTLASGFGSTALGFRTTARAYGGISLGVLNDDTDTPDGFNAALLDRIFQVGNGDINTLARSNALTVLRNGHVGIGTHNPVAPLSFSGTVGQKIALFGDNDQNYGIGILPNQMLIHSNEWGSDIVFGYGSVNLYGENMRIKGNGNVGIGVSPTEKLHVGYGTVRIEGATFQNGRALSIGGYGNLEIDAAGTVGGRFIVDGNGNTGIGNPAPDFPLSFSGALGDKVSLWGNSGPHYGFGIQSNRLQIHTDASNSDILFGHGSSASFTENMRIKGTGNVGIGTITPQMKLHVARAGQDIAVLENTQLLNTNVTTALYFKNTDRYTAAIKTIGQSQVEARLAFFAFATGDPDNMLEYMSILDNGSVGIGTTNPTQKLQVAGNVCAAGTFLSCSDMRYKKDFVPLSNSLKSLMLLNAFYYHWKQDEFPVMQFNDKRQLGFSAQDVEKFFPEVVMTDANGYKSVDYGRFTPILAEAIKEQQKSIDDQQQNIDKQQQRINDLEKELSELKAAFKKFLNQ